MTSRVQKVFILSVAALVLAVATGAAVMAAVDNDDDSPGTSQTTDSPANACLEGATDCDDNPGGDAAGYACLEGATDCSDNPAETGGDVESICIEGAEDCDDTIDSGVAAGRTCLVGTSDCVDTPGLVSDDN